MKSKRVSGIIRILSGLIDYIIVAFPVILIMVMVFQVSEGQAELMMKLLFAVYGVLLMEYMDGATIGKRFGRIKVMTEEGTKPSMVELGMRELVKTLYFVPWVGWTLAAISGIMLFFGEGRALHDRVARTRVIYVWNQVKLSDEV